MARNLRIRVDHNTCVGNAMCETFAANVFRLNDSRQSEAVDPSTDCMAGHIGFELRCAK